MKLLILALSIGSFTSAFADSACGDWTPFKDEKCVKKFDELKTFDDAVKFCHEKEAGLVSIGSAEEQNFLVDYLYKKENVKDDVWLAARYVSKNGKLSFRWLDDTELKYTNWNYSYPHNSLDKACVDMKYEYQGKWADGTCDRHNLVVCQKPQTWSNVKLQQTLLDTRKECSESIEAERRESKAELAQTKAVFQERIDKLEKNPIPIGFIYAQLPNQPEPKILWPTVEWKDISSEYAGLFFRTEGGGAAAFGTVQAENAPRITEIRHQYHSDDKHEISIKLPIGSWSSYPGIFTSWDVNSHIGTHTQQLYTSGGEVRPRNMAMKIWERVK